MWWVDGLMCGLRDHGVRVNSASGLRLAFSSYCLATLQAGRR